MTPTDVTLPPPPGAPRPRPTPRTVAALRRTIADLREEREGILERCRIAESAACQNLQYAQAARQAMETLAERIEDRLSRIEQRLAQIAPP